jgi:hypothetical protein
MGQRRIRKRDNGGGRKLTSEIVEAARQRGRELDPWETAKELLVEFEAAETGV